MMHSVPRETRYSWTCIELKHSIWFLYKFNRIRFLRVYYRPKCLSIFKEGPFIFCQKVVLLVKHDVLVQVFSILEPCSPQQRPVIRIETIVPNATNGQKNGSAEDSTRTALCFASALLISPTLLDPWGSDVSFVQITLS